MSSESKVFLCGHARAKVLYRFIPPRFYVPFRAYRTRAKSRRRGERELHILEHLVPRDRVAVDVGANRGVYSYFLSKLAERVIAYEAIPAMADFLECAGLANVEVRRLAVCDRREMLKFSVPIDPSGAVQFNGGQLGEDIGCEAETLEVQGVRLDDEELGDVGFLKIDVEGHEEAVLRGARETLARCSPVVMLEILGLASGDGHSPIFDLMDEMGYCACFYDGNSIVPLCRAKLDVIGRNFLFFPSGRRSGRGG